MLDIDNPESKFFPIQKNFEESFQLNKTNSKFDDKNAMPISAVNNTMISQINYDDVMSRAGQGDDNLEHDFRRLMNENNQENQEEEKNSSKLSSSRCGEEDDNPINPIKDFNTKTSISYKSKR